MAKAINEVTYNEGRAAYIDGETIRQLVMRAEHNDDDDEDAVPSLVCGFLDGFLSDIRKVMQK